MKIMDLIIAIYGALLSTALLIYELLKHRKRLSIILQHVAWYETINIIITNTGHRPVTLTSLSMEVFIPDQSFWEPVPQTVLFSEKMATDVFPTTIIVGDSISIPLGPILTQDLLKNRLNAKIIICDSEGKEYSNYKAQIYDAKWGTSQVINRNT